MHKPLLPFSALFLICFGLFFLTACRAGKKSSETEKVTTQSLLRVCPEAWYRNAMPGPGKEHPEEYLVVNGTRAETRDYDLEWIRKNCTVNTPTVVY